MSDKDYKQDIVINASALETEWLRQPGLYLKYAELLADARRQAKKAAERVKVCRSELVERAQGNPQGCLNSEKATSQLIEAYYRTHKDHKEAKTKLVDAEYEADIYDAAVFAFHQRKAALENLVRLHLAGYYSEPKADVDGEDVKTKALDSASTKQKKSMNRKRGIKK